MCFNWQMSAFFSALFLISAIWFYRLTGMNRVTICIIYFMLMEMLQIIQQFDLAESVDDPLCRTFLNQFLTILGFLHIMFQPYFLNGLFETTRIIRGMTIPEEAFAWTVVRRLCLVMAAMQIMRLVLSPGFNADQLDNRKRMVMSASTEWLDGPQMCNYRGYHHLAWGVPLAPPTYFLTGTGIHFFMMVFPLACIDWRSFFFICLPMVLTGPVLAGFITPNLQEQASIWCFFSVFQVCGGAAGAIYDCSHKRLRAYRAETGLTPEPEGLRPLISLSKTD